MKQMLAICLAVVLASCYKQTSPRSLETADIPAQGPSFDRCSMNIRVTPSQKINVISCTCNGIEMKPEYDTERHIWLFCGIPDSEQ